ncbi:hypothetical protein ACFPM3_19650 [Streptomyces coeruleoprunus]|uniref:Uncharacterized protein n=1 Tax=Streptomyces coeruleoprunus TaxID=285563 RepID=A0ABV9XG11_9ACTN
MNEAALRSEVTAGRGGAMTDEVGVVTGDLTVITARAADGLAHITVAYTGAEESYTLTGSPVPVPPDGVEALHTRVLDAIRAGGAAEVPR